MIFRERQTSVNDTTKVELVPPIQLSPDHPRPDAQRRRVSGGAIALATTGELLGLRDYIQAHDGLVRAHMLLGDGDDVSAWKFTNVLGDLPPDETPRLVHGEAARQIARIAKEAGVPVEDVESLSDVKQQTGLIEHTGPIPAIRRTEAPAVSDAHRAAQVDIGTGQMESSVVHFYD